MHSVFFVVDIILRWVAMAVNSTQHPSPCPPPSVWRQIHWFPVSQWTCKGQFLSVCVCVFMCERQTERKRHSERVRCKNTLCCLCFCIIIIILYTPFWLQCYHALLNGRHLSLAIIFQSVLIHKSETLKMLQKTPCKCLCGWQAFTQFCSPTLVFESMR